MEVSAQHPPSDVSAHSPLLRLLPSERRVFNAYSYGLKKAPPFSCIHHAFESHAASLPDALAVIDDFGPSTSITFSELDQQANCLAHRLRDEFGVSPGKRVCLLVERSIAMVVGILGILKSGAAYIPLDGNIVADSTLEHVLRDSGASLVLCLSKYVHRVQSKRIHTISLEDSPCSSSSSPCCCEKPSDLSKPDDSVYIVYTSGTTGVPKGVDVMHRNVANLVCMSPGNIEMRPGRRVSQLMNVSFDMAAWEVLGSLSNGCTLVLRGKSSAEWRATMKKVDIVIATPSMLFPHDPADYPNIKVIAVAGEVCPQNLADKWAAHGVNFYNSCGPTEITIVNTMVPHPHIPGEAMNIGTPTPNNNVYVLKADSEDLCPASIGEVGLMWAGGSGITRGYLNLPDKTQERYMIDPFTADGGLMFNTGDLGRWRSDGTLEHLGRIDDQVKVKGFRVELDGVAAAMETCPGVTKATALLIDDTLWGFYTPQSVNAADVKSSVSKIQPYYAVPSKYLGLSEFPNTSNNKVDKRILRRYAQDEVCDMVAPTVVAQRQAGKPKTMPANESDGALPYVHAVDEKDMKTSQTIVVAASVSSSTIEKGDQVPWEGYEDEEIPEKTQGRFLRNVRHQIFSLYRRLFGVVFITNISILIAIMAKGETSCLRLGQIVIANLFCAILMRQDYVINAFFTVFCAVPSSWPMAIRRVCARVYSIGGLHSGCAVSGAIWLILFTVQATREVVRGGKISIATVAVTYTILLIICFIMFFAYPTLRTSKHDNFERTHRFLGWTCTALVWVQVILLTNDYKLAGVNLGSALVTSPPFWLVTILTCSIILPWIRLRKVPVRAEVLSSHAIRLYFDYVTPKSGSFTRISESPLMEWHGFATIPEPGMKGYSLVVSRAGDWTSKQIDSPPKELWVRGIPTYGVLRIVPLFRRIVLVATGSGIGPCTSCILEKKIPIKLLWTSPDVRKTFGDNLVDSILTAAPDAVIYDTRKHGKPDMVKLTYRLVRDFDAEAVCIISNQKLTRKVVYGMMSRGIPAFGAIWDS